MKMNLTVRRAWWTPLTATFELLTCCRGFNEGEAPVMVMFERCSVWASAKDRLPHHAVHGWCELLRSTPYRTILLKLQADGFRCRDAVMLPSLARSDRREGQPPRRTASECGRRAKRHCWYGVSGDRVSEQFIKESDQLGLKTCENTFCLEFPPDPTQPNGK
jgi:hypothetical protein